MKKRSVEIPNHKSMNDASEELGMHRGTLYRWLEKLHIVPGKIGNYSFLSDDDIQRIKQERNTEE